MAVRLFMLLLLCVLSAGAVRAQQDGLLQIDDEVHRFLLRQQTAGRLPGAHLSHQPLSAYEARRYLDSLAVRREALSGVDRLLLDRFRGERPGPNAARVHRRLGPLYRNGRDLFAVEGDGYAFQVNPLLYLALGRARATDTLGASVRVGTWQNTRGIRAAGHIGRHFFFEARLEEVQRRDVRPAYDTRFTAPRLAFVRFDSTAGVYDYQVATGVLGLRTRFFEVRFGRDRNRWGFGRNSLVLSNYATLYDQLQLRTTVWRLQYTNLFVALSDLTPVPPGIPNQLIPQKYGAFHRLALDLPGRLQLELFESVIFSTDDARGRTGFELSYLNPVIFYRAAEADRGSADNALLGAGAAWTVLAGARVYTQLLLDELVVSEIGKGAWVNKWGWLAGVHLVDLPLPQLSVRLEYARLRPYLYSHMTPQNAFVHHDDLLGHPAGPNTIDVALSLDYRPSPRLEAALNVAYTRRGRNTAEVNYGANPLQPYTTFVAERGMWLLQGVRQRQLLVEGHAGYELLPGLFAALALRAEHLDDAAAGRDFYIAPSALLRWGLPFQSLRY